MNNFVFNGQAIYYFVKDIDIKLKEYRDKEMASAIMVICDEKQNQIDVFGVYDEKNKVLYAMPADAERWYIDYLKETDK